MEDFFRALYGALPGWARALANPVIQRFIQLYRFFFTLFKATIPNWRMIVRGAMLLRQGVANLGFQTYHTLRWLRDVRIPQVVNAARDLAIRTAVTLINRAVAPLSRGLMDLRLWTLGRLAAAARDLEAIRRTLAKELFALSRTVAQIAKRVLFDWATPQRLAAWLVGAMWMALWRYGFSQVDRIAEFFWRRRQALLLRGVAEVERQLGRLL